MPLSESDAEKLALAIARALQQARSVSDSVHYDHHRWIEIKMERERQQALKEEEKALFWYEMHSHAKRWGAACILTALFYALWLYAKEYSK